MEFKMLFRKTRDIIVETATLIKGVKESQDTMQKDFKNHISAEDEKIDGLYNVIKECHESCSESDRFNDYIKEANGTLKRIELKYDNYHQDTKETKLKMDKRQDDYLAKLQTIKDEVKSMVQEKKTFRQVLADGGKILGYIVIIAGLVFGIIRYTEARKAREDIGIEKLLKEIIKEQAVGKERRED
jgi:hypothetical protein